MADYIEREALSKWLHETMSAQTTIVGVAYVRDFWNKVMDAPAADVAPVVHGRWEEYIDQDEFWDELVSEKCSVCGTLHYSAYNYCPNCGAKMDGDSNG